MAPILPGLQFEKFLSESPDMLGGPLSWLNSVDGQFKARSTVSVHPAQLLHQDLYNFRVDDVKLARPGSDPYSQLYLQLAEVPTQGSQIARRAEANANNVWASILARTTPDAVYRRPALAPLIHLRNTSDRPYLSSYPPNVAGNRASLRIVYRNVRDYAAQLIQGSQTPVVFAWSRTAYNTKAWLTALSRMGGIGEWQLGDPQQYHAYLNVMCIVNDTSPDSEFEVEVAEFTAGNWNWRIAAPNFPELLGMMSNYSSGLCLRDRAYFFVMYSAPSSFVVGGSALVQDVLYIPQYSLIDHFTGHQAALSEYSVHNEDTFTTGLFTGYDIRALAAGVVFHKTGTMAAVNAVGHVALRTTSYPWLSATKTIHSYPAIEFAATLGVTVPVSKLDGRYSAASVDVRFPKSKAGMPPSKLYTDGTVGNALIFADNGGTVTNVTPTNTPLRAYYLSRPNWLYTNTGVVLAGTRTTFSNEIETVDNLSGNLETRFVDVLPF